MNYKISRRLIGYSACLLNFPINLVTVVMTKNGPLPVFNRTSWTDLFACPQNNEIADN